MSCCAAASFFSSRVAERDLKRYKRRGPDTSTRLLLDELRRQALGGLHLVDIGSGIGAIEAELAGAGLARVTLVDASPAYLEVARRHIGSLYGSRSEFVLADFAATGVMAEADIVTLDRVVCCYPDADGLLGAAAAKSRRLVAFTHPRDRWYLRAGFGLLNFILWVARSPFRTFVHPPERMAEVLERAGFVRSAHSESLVWEFEFYHRR